MSEGSSSSSSMNTAANNDIISRMNIIENDLIELESQSKAKICTDESNLEQQGYQIERQTVISLINNNNVSNKNNIHSCIYRSNISTLFIKPNSDNNPKTVCKIISLNDQMTRQKDRENFLNNSIRIIRFVGGYNRSESRHHMFIHVYEIFKIDMKIYIFMDEFNGKSILYIIKHHEKYTQCDARKWIEALCNAITFLHCRGIAHRSIRLENILIPINNNNNDSYQNKPKLCGLNRSVIFVDRTSNSKNKIIKQKREKKSYEYYHLPPESFNESSYDPSIADVWSIGVILIATHTRRYVFNIKSKIDFNQQWKNFVEKHSKDINPVITRLLDALFLNNPKERSTLKDIVDHEYFHMTDEQLVKISVPPVQPSPIADQISTTTKVVAEDVSSRMMIESKTEDKNEKEMSDNEKERRSPPSIDNEDKSIKTMKMDEAKNGQMIE